MFVCQPLLFLLMAAISPGLGLKLTTSLSILSVTLGLSVSTSTAPVPPLLASPGLHCSQTSALKEAIIPSLPGKPSLSCSL